MSTSETYRRFAEEQACGRSPLYEQWAKAVADDPEVLAVLDRLPEPKRQPNLLFAAMRHRFGLAADWPAFRATMLQRTDDLLETMRCHSTQTNEPGRCAVLLPLLARLPQPLALVEVGASAGLCLLPDRYAYRYGGQRFPEAGDDGRPVFPCELANPDWFPAAMPEIVWRAGLDLSPVDPADPDRAAWLRALVWPEQTGRAVRLDAALAVARADPPPVRAGDLLTDLPALLAEAPDHATLVVFHTAVLAYLPLDDRRRFAAAVSGLCDAWISNESPRTMPDIAGRAAEPCPADRFIMALNGRPVAWTDPHGAGVSFLTAPDGLGYSSFKRSASPSGSL